MLNALLLKLIFSVCLDLNPPMILGVNDAGESFGIEGETVILFCGNDNSDNLDLEFQWFDSEGGVLTLPGLVQPHQFTFDHVVRNQSGVYVCVVSFGEASLSVNTTLIVQCK